jgi:hypothetical protein
MKKPIKELVKRQDWQKLRSSLVGTWMKNTVQNCSKLRNWLGNVSGTTEDKLRIMMNYLTGSAFRIGIIKHSCISDLRASISAELKKRKYRKITND